MLRKLIVFALLLTPAWGWAEPLRVFVSVLPQKTFVERLGGDRVEVRTMVQPGYNPATYNPTPKQISALANAALYVRIGVPFERVWMERIRTANPNMQIFDARQGIRLQLKPRHEQMHENDTVWYHHSNRGQAESRTGWEPDPHIWTSPPLVKHLCKNIRDTLSALDPANEQNYARNFDAYAVELDALDREIRTLLSGLKNRRFMVFHPSWGYFADTYGMIQVPVEREGKEPGPRSLTALIKQAKRDNLKVILVQPQFPTKFAQQVAHAIGGRVVTVDPLAADYAENLRSVAQQIAAAAQPL